MELIPVPVPLRGGRCWHYTNAAGLVGIVKDGSFWASSATTALNDSSEMEHGLEMVRAAWMTIRADFASDVQARIDRATSIDFVMPLVQRFFVLSASTSGDLLNQWMHYTEGHGFGFAIELDMSERLTTEARRSIPKWLQSGRVNDPRAVFPSPGWRQVVYIDQDKIDQAVLLLRFLAENPMHIPGEDPIGSDHYFLIELATHFKHSAFGSEMEVRSVFATIEDQPQFRAAGDRIIPYVRAVPSEVSQGLPLKSITCGPGSTARSRATVTALLEAHGYGDIPVSSSSMPLLS